MNAPPVRENGLDHGAIFYTGDDPKCPAAGRAALGVDAEDASQALCLHALGVQPIALRGSRSVGSA